MSSLGDLRELQTAAAANQGKVVAFRGEVETIDSSADRTALQIRIDGQLLSRQAELLAVTWPAPVSELELSRHDRIIVVGRIAGTLEGTNAFGGTISILKLEAFAITNAKGRRQVLEADAAAYKLWRNGSPEYSAETKEKFRSIAAPRL
jgi:hypothetical protein